MEARHLIGAALKDASSNASVLLQRMDAEIPGLAQAARAYAEATAKPKRPLGKPPIAEDFRLLVVESIAISRRLALKHPGTEFIRVGTEFVLLAAFQHHLAPAVQIAEKVPIAPDILAERLAANLLSLSHFLLEK